MNTGYASNGQHGTANGVAAGGGVAGGLVAHLDAAHNLAHWLTGNDHDAQEIVQEAYLRAIRAAGGYRGGDAKSWLLAIVRNLCFDLLRRNKILPMTPIDDQSRLDSSRLADSDQSVDPAKILEQAENVQQVRSAIAELEPEFREVIVLREMEGLSYKQIAEMTGVPMGTVMSRLARGRRHLARILSEESSSPTLEGRP